MPLLTTRQSRASRNAPQQSNKQRETSSSRSSPKDAVRGLSYHEGHQFLSPNQMAPNQDAVQLAQRSVQAASLSATLEQDNTVYRNRGLQILFEGGSRLSVRLDPFGLHFTCEPGILVKVRHAPDLRITHIRWDFAQARFDCSATANWFDILSIIGKLGETRIEQFLNSKLRPRLPAAVRKPGYSPTTDPNLAQTIAELSNVFNFVLDKSVQSTPTASQTQPTMHPPGPERLKSPSAFIAIRMPEDFRVPLGSQGFELFVQRGTPLYITAKAKGSLTQPVVDLLVVEAAQQGIVARPTSGHFRSLKEIKFKAITISHGGKFEFDYDLSVEELGKGLLALVALLGLAAGRDVGTLPDVKLREIRKEIDARLQREVPPRFKALLKQYDRLVPGVSLTTVFGV